MLDNLSGPTFASAPPDSVRTRDPIVTLRVPAASPDFRFCVKVGLYEDETAQRLGLTAAEIKAFVTAVLTENALPVFPDSRDAFIAAGGTVYLGVYIDLREIPAPNGHDARLAYSFTVSYQQPAYLPENNVFIDMVNSWFNGALGYATIPEAKTALLASLRSETEIFAEDWRISNGD